jgi:transposase
MLYQRSSNIERRLAAVLDLIRAGGYSTPRIAEKVGVSIPTVSRDVMALRQRGHEIRAEKGADGWRYVLFADGKQEPGGSRVLARLGA